MSSNKTDISQLRQYLNGELDARAMHELERRAQDDPFLMDALEGYESTGVRPGQPDAELHQRLQQRINQPVRKLIPWAGISIAASVLLAGSIGLWLYLAQQKPAVNQVAAAPAAVIAPNEPAVPAATQPPALPRKLRDEQVAVVLTRKPVQRQAGTPYPVQASAPAPAADVLKQVPDSRFGYTAPADTVPQYAAEGYYKPQKMVILGDNKKISTIKPGSRPELMNQQLAGRADGVNMELAPGQSHEITGQLIDDAGRPLPGALVSVKGVGAKALTDQNGNFKIKAEGSDMLQLSYMGYQSREVKATAGDSMKLALQPAQNLLGEVAVARAAPAVPVKKGAAPSIGVKAYQQFLNSFKAPDHQTGIIRLELTIGANGNLSNFKVLQGLAKDADQAAIAYVKQGPAWQGNPNGKPETVVIQLNIQ